MSFTDRTMSINLLLLNTPRFLAKRAWETVLTWCAIEKLVFFSPPSGGTISIIAGESLPDFVYQPVLVTGTTMLKPNFAFI